MHDLTHILGRLLHVLFQAGGDVGFVQGRSGGVGVTGALGHDRIICSCGGGGHLRCFWADSAAIRGVGNSGFRRFTEWGEALMEGCCICGVWTLYLLEATCLRCPGSIRQFGVEIGRQVRVLDVDMTILYRRGMRSHENS